MAPWERASAPAGEFCVDFIGYFDGACEPVNPGGTMAFAAVVFENGKQIWQSSGIAVDPPTGPTTNNLAEYTALVQLLGHFIDEKLTDRAIEVRGDSQLVINQMWGTWSISEESPLRSRGASRAGHAPALHQHPGHLGSA
jgi:ribonuclease HI